MREMPTAGGHHAFTDEWISQHFPSSDRIAPELQAGDALVFDHWTLHRTEIVERETISRVTIECRVTQQAAYLAALPQAGSSATQAR
jgi:hypothetical protein